MEIPKAIDQMFSYFAVVHAPRRQHPTTLHSLEAILTMTILATICGAQNWVEIEQWGQAHHQWLAEFLDLTHGIPSHDTFGRVFALLEPTKLQQAFMAWMSALAKLAEEVIALAACRRDNAMANYKALRFVRSRPFAPEKPYECIRECSGA
jgi:DDE_Tnp_1-associated